MSFVTRFRFLFFCEDSPSVGQVGVRESPITSHLSPITLVAACRAVFFVAIFSKKLLWGRSGSLEALNLPDEQGLGSLRAIFLRSLDHELGNRAAQSQPRIDVASKVNARPKPRLPRFVSQGIESDGVVWKQVSENG